MQKIMNKASVGILGTVFALAAISAPAAQAATDAETIAGLQATIAELIKSLATLTGETTPIVVTTTTEGYANHPGINYEFRTNLKVGSRGEAVRMLQRIINTGVDGVFGPGTKGAVANWQRSKGLVGDGHVGPATRVELNRKATVVTRPITRPITTPATTRPGTSTIETPSVTGDKLVVRGELIDELVVGSNQKVIFSKLTFTAGDRDVKVRDINIEYEGTADRLSIDKVLLLDSAKLEIDSDTIDSNDEAKLDVDIIVKRGQSATVYVGAIVASLTNTSGLTVTLNVASVRTDGAEVEGDSVTGASHEINSGISGSSTFDANVTVEETGDVRIGQEELKVAVIEVENKSDNDDPQIVKSIKIEKIKHSGSLAGDDALENVIIKVNGVTYKSEQDDEYYTFNFGDGIELTETRDEEEFNVYVDVVDDAGTKFAFKLKDIVVLDSDGIFLTQEVTSGSLTDTIANQYTDSTDEATIGTSDVTIRFTDEVLSEDTSAGVGNVEIGSFDVEVEGSNVEGNFEVTIELNGASSASDVSDIELENVAIYTANGDKVSDREDASFSAKTDGTQVTVTFDDVTFRSGDDAIDYVVKADINEDVPDGTNYQIVKYEYMSIEDVNRDDVSDVTKTSSSSAVISVEGAVISVSIEEADDTSVNDDTEEIEIVKIELDASNSGDNIKVSSVKVAFSVTRSGNSNSDLLDELRNCQLYDDRDDRDDRNDRNSVSGAKTGSSSVTFNLDNGGFTVNKNSRKILSLRCDIGSNLTTDDVILVSGIDYEAKSVRTDNNLDGTFTDSEDVTVTDGSATLTKSSNEVNNAKIVRDNKEDVIFGRYDFETNDGELTIDTVTVTFNQDVRNLIDGNLKLYIIGENGMHDTASTSNGMVYTFTENKRLSREEEIEIEIRGDVRAVNDDIHITNVAITTNPRISIGAVTETTSTFTEVKVVTAIPEVEKVNVDSSNLETSSDVLLFGYKVTAKGGNVTMGHTVFEVDLTNVEFINAEVKVYDNAEMTGSTRAERVVTLAGSDTNIDVDLTSVTIREGNTYWVYLVADPTTTADTRSVRVQVSDAAYAANTTGFNFTGVQGNLLIERDMKSLLKKD